MKFHGLYRFFRKKRIFQSVFLNYSGFCACEFSGFSEFGDFELPFSLVVDFFSCAWRSRA